MDNPFLQAIFVQPRVVMGRQLLPLSAYHAAALMLLDSPFIVSSDDPLTHDDLVLACYVCSFGVADGPTSLFPELDMVGILEWGASCKDIDNDAEFEAFSVYLNDYLTFPEMWQPTDAGATKTSGIPWPVYCVTTVLQNMRGITEQEAWDMPLNKLVAYKCAIAEQNGAEVVSEKQRNYAKWLALMEQEALEAKEKELDNG